MRNVICGKINRKPTEKGGLSMCTAATYMTKDFYFGRTLDYEFSYGEEVVVAPRKFPFFLRRMGKLDSHYAMIGMAHVTSGCPLFYDAVNEKGLAMAGLNFPGNAVYRKQAPGKDNVATFEFIPWILGQCATVGEAKALLERINLLDIPFSETLPPARLHWILADRHGAVTVESVADGLQIYDNPVGVLANNPPFDWQLLHLSSYMHLSPRQPRNLFSESLPLEACSRGMGAIGLPGDLSSQSRFVRAAFVRANSVSGNSESESVGQFFHILGAVEQPRGCCDLGDDKYAITIYTSCCNADKGIYYYTTYENRQITAIDMRRENLAGSDLVRYPLITEEQIRIQN